MSFPRPVTIAAAAMLLAIAGCGGDKKQDDDPTPTATATATAAPRVEAISNAQTKRIVARMPRERVLDLLGPPQLEQGPTDDFAGGCLFYPMQKRSLLNTWQFCFNDEGVAMILTAFAAPDLPAPPKDASPTRAALIGRADSLCQSDYGLLTTITEDTTKALDVYGRKGTKASRAAVGRQLARFVENLEHTAHRLAAFKAPPDKLDVFNGYLENLREQIDVLSQARQALLDGDDATYDELGTRFSEIGKEARRQAKDYGFTMCGASTFS